MPGRTCTLLKKKSDGIVCVDSVSNRELPHLDGLDKWAVQRDVRLDGVAVDDIPQEDR